MTTFAPKLNSRLALAIVVRLRRFRDLASRDPHDVDRVPYDIGGALLTFGSFRHMLSDKHIMGIYDRQFGDRICQIRIKQLAHGPDVSAHIVRVGEVVPQPPPGEDFPVLPNEAILLDGMTRWLRQEYGPEELEP